MTIPDLIAQMQPLTTLERKTFEHDLALTARDADRISRGWMIFDVVFPTTPQHNV